MPGEKREFPPIETPGLAHSDTAMSVERMKDRHASVIRRADRLADLYDDHEAYAGGYVNVDFDTGEVTPDDRL